MSRDNDAGVTPPGWVMAGEEPTGPERPEPKVAPPSRVTGVTAVMYTVGIEPAPVKKEEPTE